MWYIGTCVCLSHHLWDPLTYVDAAGTGSRVKKFTAVCRDCGARECRESGCLMQSPE